MNTSHTWFVFSLQSIETELLERLKNKNYGDIYNYPDKEYKKVLEMEEMLLEGKHQEEEEVPSKIYTDL